MTSKTCTKCHVSKELDQFGKHSQMADGHLNQCKECKKAYNKKYRNQPEKKKRIQETNAKSVNSKVQESKLKMVIEPHGRKTSGRPTKDGA